ncbi:hypothetical protein JTE90_007196 [Oedothorax gibbosus]|uniref:Uncharacterized protein n=1 Tax=Oedothorax gibbosus TaxID=931172 RepID=A0AAV6UCU0_9ARAC|nr:hypothetical protein JTE90_007196 [Oedothorax gibbosus]
MTLEEDLVFLRSGRRSEAGVKEKHSGIVPHTCRLYFDVGHKLFSTSLPKPAEIHLTDGPRDIRWCVVLVDFS